MLLHYIHSWILLQIVYLFVWSISVELSRLVCEIHVLKWMYSLVLHISCTIEPTQNRKWILLMAHSIALSPIDVNCKHQFKIGIRYVFGGPCAWSRLQSIWNIIRTKVQITKYCFALLYSFFILTGITFYDTFHGGTLLQSYY